MPLWFFFPSFTHLIYGLPLQTLTSFSKKIDNIIDIPPDRIAVFNYAHVPWLKPHQKLIKEEDLPRIVLNGHGRLFIRNITMCFDAYLERIAKEKPVFSKTV